MQAALTFLWFLPSIVFGVGTVITLVALRRAPEGRENDEGFQYLRSSHTPAPAPVRDSSHVVHSAGARLA